MVITPCRLVVSPCNVPDETVVPPENVLLPVKTVVPVPVKVKAPEPVKAPESVALPEVGLWITPPALVTEIDVLLLLPAFRTSVPPANTGL